MNPAAFQLCTSSIQSFMVSIGLPQYIPLLLQRNISSVETLINNVHVKDLANMGITNPGHIKRLRHNVKFLRHRASKVNGGTEKLDQPKRTDSGYSTIDRVKAKKKAEQ